MLQASEIIDLLGGTAKVARLMGVRPPSVHEWRERGIPEDKMLRLAVPLEEQTCRRVRRWHLRPDDWHRIWPELIGTEGAPDIPADEGVRPCSLMNPSPVPPAACHR